MRCDWNPSYFAGSITTMIFGNPTSADHRRAYYKWIIIFWRLYKHILFNLLMIINLISVKETQKQNCVILNVPRPPPFKAL